jgi:GT2 family glycosyltransferase
MDLITTDAPEVAKETMARYAERNVGVVGGLVSRTDGSQEPYNFGPVFSLGVNLTAGLPFAIDKLKDTHPSAAKAIQRVGRAVMEGWPNVLAKPEPTPTFWLHEGNMLVYSDVFKHVGGYDPKLRAHETQDLSIRLEKLGIKRQFDPSIEVVHHYIDVRGDARNSEQFRAMAYMIRKHGLGQWLTGNVGVDSK